MPITLWIITASALGAPRAALGTTAEMPRTVLAPGAPIEVYLEMENRTDEVLYFEQHVTTPCFLNKFADIEASPPIKAKPPPGEEQCKVPGAKIKPGDTVSRTVNLRESYFIEDQDYSYFEIKWKDGGPDIYSPLVEKVGPVRFAEPFHSGRLAKGDEYYLPNKTTIVFDGHGSKPSGEPGKSPLLVLNFTVRVPGEGESTKEVVLDAERVKQFPLQGYTFDLVDHQFDQWMDIRIFMP